MKKVFVGKRLIRLLPAEELLMDAVGGGRVRLLQWCGLW